MLNFLPNKQIIFTFRPFHLDFPFSLFIYFFLHSSKPLSYDCKQQLAIFCAKKTSHALSLLGHIEILRNFHSLFLHNTKVISSHVTEIIHQSLFFSYLENFHKNILLEFSKGMERSKKEIWG